MKQANLIKEINKLKHEKNAVILVHNYQRPEIYEVADYIGDSLGLSKEAAKTQAGIIVFCGVDFMAETAKLLSPEKRVLLPCISASCPMAAMATVAQIGEMRKKHPKAAVVTYVNSTAEAKAASDICCTSANAVKVVNSLPHKEIIFTPDKNLGSYVAKHTKKKVHLWDGYCYVHNTISPNKIKQALKNNPDAELIAHPECPPAVLEQAHHICSTSQMMDIKSKSKKFIVATEEGMLHRLNKTARDRQFMGLGKICFNMKKTTLQHVLDALLHEKHEVEVPEEVRIQAEQAVRRMLDVKC